MEAIKTLSINDLSQFKSNEMTSFTIEITPLLAQRLLTLSNGNRNLSPINLMKLKTAMLNNEFYGNNGESIKFDVDGFLKDGHHRLTAIKESGTTQTMLVITGCGHTETIDKGKSRSMKDTMVMSSNEETRNNSYLAKLGVCCLRLLKDISFTNRGFKDEFPYREAEIFINENSVELATILETYKGIKKRLIKENAFINGKYDKKEDAIICSLMWFAHKQHNISYPLIYTFVQSIFSVDSCEDKELNAFRRKVINDSQKIKHNRWDFNMFRDFFIKEIVKYNNRTCNAQ